MGTNATRSSKSTLRALRLLVEQLGVDKVVWVDDVFAVGLEEVIGQYEVNPGLAQLLRKLTGQGFADDPDARSGQIRRFWEGADSGTRDTVLQEVCRAFSGEHGLGDAADLLPQVFPRAKISRVSLARWQADRAQLVPPETATGVLILLDRSFDREQSDALDAGIRELGQLIGDGTAGQPKCALLTKTIAPERLLEERDCIAREFGLKRERFFVIPKAWLSSQDHLPSFARGLRLCLLSPAISTIKQSYSMALSEATTGSQHWLEHEFDIEDFAQAVLSSSAREGARELDTLTRLVNLDFLGRLLEHSYDSVDEGVLQQVRAVAAIETNTGAGELSYSRVRELQAREWYEDEDRMKKRHLPLDVGDIFEVAEPGRETQDRYVLVANPCELAVRGHGKRDCQYEDRMIVLCKIRERDAAPEADRAYPYFRLQFYGSAPNTVHHFVALHDRRLVAPWLLDLCVLHPTGDAAISQEGEPPRGISAAWRKRYAIIRGDYVSNVTRRHTELVACGVGDDDTTDALSRAVSPDGLLTVRVEGDGRGIAANLRRVGRLRRPYSLWLLTRFSQVISRAPLPHDLV